MNNLPKVVTQRCLEPTDRTSNALPVALPRHLLLSSLSTFCHHVDVGSRLTQSMLTFSRVELIVNSLLSMSQPLNSPLSAVTSHVI